MANTSKSQLIFCFSSPSGASSIVIEIYKTFFLTQFWHLVLDLCIEHAALFFQTIHFHHQSIGPDDENRLWLWFLNKMKKIGQWLYFFLHLDFDDDLFWYSTNQNNTFSIELWEVYRIHDDRKLTKVRVIK